MTPITIKCAPALPDRTVEPVTSQEEGWEAVLCETKEDDPTLDLIAVAKACEDTQVFQLIERRQWTELLDHITANPEAVRTKGKKGCSPLYYACASGASTAVVQMLVDMFPEAVRMIDENYNMLPLHMASKRGLSEGTLMALLTSYPEATMVQDDFGTTPLAYARSLPSESVRMHTSSCLERGPWLCAVSAYSKQKTEQQYKKQIRDIEQAQNNRTWSLKAKQAIAMAKLKAEMEEETSKLNAKLKAEKLKFMEVTKNHEEEMRALKIKVSHQESKIEALEGAMEHQGTEYGGKLETVRQQVLKTQVELDIKVTELKVMSTESFEAHRHKEAIAKELQQKDDGLETALKEVGRLSDGLERLNARMTSIRHMAALEGASACSEVRDTAPGFKPSPTHRAKPGVRFFSEQTDAAKNNREAVEILTPSKKEPDGRSCVEYRKP
jgi:hypothetical protein